MIAKKRADFCAAVFSTNSRDASENNRKNVINYFFSISFKRVTKLLM